MLITVADPRDDRLGDYVRLRETSLRRHLESVRGLFIAEGAKVIRRALDAGYRPRSFLLSQRWLADLADVLVAHPDVPTYVTTEDVAEQVTGFHVHRGALASMHRIERYRVADLLTARRLVVIEDLVDHANVGSVLRNAAGLGWDGVLLSPRSADPLYRRAIKVSMGAVFSLPWARLADWRSTPDLLRAAGFTVLALTLSDDAVDLDSVRVRPDERLAVLLGTEGAGLSPAWSEAADLRVTIMMSRGIDSLNVAAAAAIACYRLGSRGETGQSSG